MLRNCESRNSRNQSCKVDKTEKSDTLPSQNIKPLNNPFFNLNTIVCFTMALNDPNAQKKLPLF